MYCVSLCVPLFRGMANISIVSFHGNNDIHRIGLLSLQTADNLRDCQLTPVFVALSLPCHDDIRASLLEKDANYKYDIYFVPNTNGIPLSIKHTRTNSWTTYLTRIIQVAPATSESRIIFNDLTGSTWTIRYWLGQQVIRNINAARSWVLVGCDDLTT